MDTKWFRDRISDKGLSANKLANMIGMDRSAMSKMLNGHRRMMMDEAADIARALGVPLDEVVRHAGIEVARQNEAPVPIIGVALETGEIVAPAGEFSHGPRKADRPQGLPDDAAAIRVRSPLSPMDGWIVYFVPTSRVEPDAIGRFSVVQLGGKGGKGGTKWLRVPSRSYEQGKWVLRGLCGDERRELSDVDLASAWPVLAIRC